MGSPSIPGFPGWAISSVSGNANASVLACRCGDSSREATGMSGSKKETNHPWVFWGVPYGLWWISDTHHLWWISFWDSPFGWISDTPEVDCSCGSDSAKSWRVRRHWTTALHLRSLGTQEFGTGRRRQLTSRWVHWRAETEQTHTVTFNEREQE